MAEAMNRGIDTLRNDRFPCRTCLLCCAAAPAFGRSSSGMAPSTGKGSQPSHPTWCRRKQYLFFGSVVRVFFPLNRDHTLNNGLLLFFPGSTSTSIRYQVSIGYWAMKIRALCHRSATWINALPLNLQFASTNNDPTGSCWHAWIFTLRNRYSGRTRADKLFVQKSQQHSVQTPNTLIRHFKRCPEI